AGLPTLQGRIIALAGGAPNLAAASIQAAFNIANSLGAYLGGVVIAAGYGYGSPNVVAAILGAVGLTLAFVSVKVERRAKGGVSPIHPHPDRERLDQERIPA
ncbi:MAG: MFS transporter, partial [Actinocrinis sp.]